MHRGRGNNNMRGFPRGGNAHMQYGPRHSSPHTLQNSPGSPNVAPIPSATPAPGPQMKLFGAPVPTIAVPWGSGAINAAQTPVTRPPSQDTPKDQSAPSAAAGDLGDRNSGKFPQETGAADQHRPPDDRSGHGDQHGGQFSQENTRGWGGRGRGGWRGQDRGNRGGGRGGGRGEASHRGTRDHRGGRGAVLREDRWEQDSRQRHGEHGAILREDIDPGDNYSEAGSRDGGRLRRDEREDKRPGDRNRPSRWEDSGDSQRGGALNREGGRELRRSGRAGLRDDREHRAILRDDREDCGSVGSSHRGARLREDFNDRDRGDRLRRDYDRSDRDRDSYREGRDDRRDGGRGRESRLAERGGRERYSDRGISDIDPDRYRWTGRDEDERSDRGGGRFSDLEDRGRGDRGRRDQGDRDHDRDGRDRYRDTRDRDGGNRSVSDYEQDYRDRDYSYNERGDSSRNSSRDYREVDRRDRAGDSFRGARDGYRHNIRDSDIGDRMDRGSQRDRDSREGFRDSDRHIAQNSDRDNMDRRGPSYDDVRGSDGMVVLDEYPPRNNRTGSAIDPPDRDIGGRADDRRVKREPGVEDREPGRGDREPDRRDRGPAARGDRGPGRGGKRGGAHVERGRSGAVLREDRNDDMPVQQRMKKQDIGRTGALLIEDTVPAPGHHPTSRAPSTAPSHTSSHPPRHALSNNTSHAPSNSQSGRDRGRGADHRDRRERSSREKSRQRSEDRSSQRSHAGQKRSFCSSQNDWHEETRAPSDHGGSVCEDGEIYSEVDVWKDSGTDGLSDRGSVNMDNEGPERKRRRRREPSEEKEVLCIRSGSPALGEAERDAPPAWVRSSPADLYFVKDQKTGNMTTTKRMQELERRFDTELVQRNARARAAQEPYNPPKPPENRRAHIHHKCGHDSAAHGKDESSSDSSDSDSGDSDSDQEEWWIEEMKRKESHPHRLHKELWHNEKGELNYGPLCRCSQKAKQSGIRHDKFPGEQPIPSCDPNSSNLNKLYHYKITISPVTNFLTKHPTIIMFDGHEYMFEGFSLFTHKKIPKLPECQLIRFFIIYTIHIIEEPPPENFSVRSLDLFSQFLFDEILELFDIDWKGPGGDDNCRLFHVMPRFARPFPENGKEIMSMNDILLYLLKAARPLVAPKELPDLLRLDKDAWHKYVDGFRYMVVTCPGKRPSSLRIDQLDKQNCDTKDGPTYPMIVHHGLRPSQLSYAGDPVYKKKWREYIKFRHLMWSRDKVSPKDKEKLEEFEVELAQIRLKCTMKREVTVDISSEGFLTTGIRADICQHAMLLPILFSHIRFHECLTVLEKNIGYEFKDKTLLQLALTHSSYIVNHGSNPDHGRNSLSNCGSRQLEFGDHKVHHKHRRKRGLSVLLSIMAKMATKREERSEIPHNERLEFLGDAVVEFITSTHLFFMFPQASEGEMTAYRGSLVQNAQLAVLANKLRLQDYLLYAHGPDLCHTGDLRHAMANCFEALLGALFLDGGLRLADRVFTRAMFDDDAELLDTWSNTPKHPLQTDEPNGDRHWIKNSPILQKLLAFEDDIGYEFINIRLLAKSFTQRNIGYNHLTLGHNQRLEFLGDTIMKLIASDYLFRHFPDHHEGHLSLLRSSVVNNKTQATVAEELGMPAFVINAQKQPQATPDLQLKQKEKADLLESLLGALYVDGGLEPCYILCNICFFPRLKDFILNQEWNDPKSQLQQCCLTLREINDETPDIPVYKVLQGTGPTHARTYRMGVYFRGKRLADGTGPSKHQGEMNAAENALEACKDLFNVRYLWKQNQRGVQIHGRTTSNSTKEPRAKEPRKK